MKNPWIVGTSMRVRRNGLTCEVWPIYCDGILVAECPAFVADEREMVANNARLIVEAVNAWGIG